MGLQSTVTQWLPNRNASSKYRVMYLPFRYQWIIFADYSSTLTSHSLGTATVPPQNPKQKRETASDGKVKKEVQEIEDKGSSGPPKEEPTLVQAGLLSPSKASLARWRTSPVGL